MRRDSSRKIGARNTGCVSQTSVLHRCYKQGDEDTGKQDLASVGKQCLRKYLFASHKFIRLCEAHRYTSLYTSKLRARDPEGYVLILSCNLLPRCYSDQDFIFLF